MGAPEGSGGGTRERPEWARSDLTRTGRPIEPRNSNPGFAAACDQAGVLRVHRQDLRPLCVALDVHPRLVMRILRHSQIAVTADILRCCTKTKRPAPTGTGL